MKDTVFTFPGQGSYHYNIIRELYLNYASFQSLFLKTDAITTAKLGCGFLPVVQAGNKQVHDAYIAQFPDLDQVGIFLTNLLIAKLHLQAGIIPDLLLGHSFGTIAALAVAEVFTAEVGVSIVCDRIVALRYSHTPGKMAALSCSYDTTRQLLKDCGKNIHIAVLNHKKQTVIAGAVEAINELKLVAAAKGISLTFIESRYPFHSPFLNPSVHPFYESLESYKFNAAVYPVYLGTEHKLYDLRIDAARFLSTQFIKPLNFCGIINLLLQSGFQNFIECGPGELISNIIRKNIPRNSSSTIYSSVANEGLAAGIDELYRKIGVPEGMVNHKASERPDYRNEESCEEMPVAIIAMGSVLPGSVGVPHLWKNISEGVNSIIDLGAIKPALREDILGGTQDGPVVDKTYTLLRGVVPDLPWNESLYGKYYSREKFEKSCLAEKMLVHATAECAVFIDNHTEIPASRIKCFMGSTAEGIAEFSYTTYLEVLEKEMHIVDPALPGNQMAGLCGILKSEMFHSSDLRQHNLCNRVVETIFNKNIETVIIDTACSSSAYATYMAARALVDNKCDLVLAGGIYAPDPACFITFAQFRGLTPTDSMPFDAKADGVVFGDGATLVAMKRLDEAIRDGDKIIGVLRAIGMSSDGKSPAINVPRTAGQKLAMERAMKKTGISIDTIQYMEAHATATVVGDAIEAKSIREITSTRTKSLPPIELGGIKALIGHAGWCASTASLLKVLKALEENTIPKQTKFLTVNKRIKLEEGNLNISIENKPWPLNIHGLPKRAGINSFGFGGTNTHTIIESYEPVYHARLLEKIMPPKIASTRFVVVGTGFLYPAANSLAQELPGQERKFDRNKMALPAGKIILPDAASVMDPSQFISSLAAEKVLGCIEDKWQQFRDKISVVIGMESGTERSAWARERFVSSQAKRLALAKMIVRKCTHNFVSLRHEI